MANASGRYAYRIDDRTGFRIPYKDAVREWTGSYVHKSEFEEKHPQLTPPRHISDPQALRQARPDSDPTNVTLNWPTTLNPVIGFTSVGEPRLSISPIVTPTGVVGTGAIGLLNIVINTNIIVTGVQGTGSIGTVVAQGTFVPSVQGTTAVGTLTPKVVAFPSGVQGTDSIGTLTPAVVIAITGVQGSSAVGTPVVDIDPAGYGLRTYGSGAYGR